ncbi:MAG TPA: hypothetical protein PK534_08515 [Chitinophagales bacterium]|nr:hypothetical protein [Chitinophagales bacterium]
MKKTIALFITILVFQFTKAQNYSKELKAVNDFLATFDNGYYGYLEIKDGYLFDRFKSGEHSKALISDLDVAVEEETNRKVVVKCKSAKSCVFSTYTDSNHEKMSFSQSTNFNTQKLITLLNNLITAYKKSPGNSSSQEDQKTLDAAADRIKKTSSKNTTTGNYQTALQKLNDYLKTFDNGYYGYFEVKDGYIYDRFKAGKYNKFKMEDIEGAVIQSEFSRVIFKCKSGNCIETDWKPNGREEYTQFTTGGSYNYKELADLLNNFRDAYLGNKKQSTSSSEEEEDYTMSSEFLDGLKSNIDIMSSSSNNSTTKTTKSTSSGDYQSALKALNDYLKIFDGDRYQGIEIKDGYIYSNYKNGKYSRAKLEDIDKVVQNNEYKYIKLTCKNESKCIYSTITGNYHDYFNFQTSTGKDLDKMFGLLNDFVAALKGKKSDNSSSQLSDAQSDRIQKLKQSGNTSTTTEKVVSNTTTTSTNNPKYAKELKALNDYLKTFNASVYKGAEVKEGKVLFKFSALGEHTSSIGISELTQNTIVLKATSLGKEEIKIQCKGESDCFYSTYSDDYVDHFRFYSYSVSDLTKMKQLVEDFIKALK